MTAIIFRIFVSNRWNLIFIALYVYLSATENRICNVNNIEWQSKSPEWFKTLVDSNIKQQSAYHLVQIPHDQPHRVTIYGLPTSRILLNKTLQATGVSSRHIVQLLAIFEYYKGRHGSNSTFLRNILLCIDVDLGELDGAELGPGGQLFKERTNHFARTTPCSPEVDDHHISRVDEGEEVGDTSREEQEEIGQLPTFVFLLEMRLGDGCKVSRGHTFR